MPKHLPACGCLSLWGACCILLFRTTLSRIILAKMGAVVKGCLVFQWVASIGITLCSVGAFATTKTQKYRHAKYACLILAPLYSLHTAPSASAGILKTNFQCQKIPGRKVECTLLPSKAVVRNFRTTHNSVTTTKFQTLSGILWYTVLTIAY